MLILFCLLGGLDIVVWNTDLPESDIRRFLYHSVEVDVIVLNKDLKELPDEYNIPYVGIRLNKYIKVKTKTHTYYLNKRQKWAGVSVNDHVELYWENKRLNMNKLKNPYEIFGQICYYFNQETP